MKIQLALLVLGEGAYRTFKIHLHDDVRERLELESKDQQAYLRDRIRRQLAVVYGVDGVGHFFFAMEDRNKDGDFTRPHAHGAVEIRPLALDQVHEPRHHRRFTRILKKHGLNVAEREAGRWATRRALRSAAGMLGYRPRTARSGLDQSRNIWTSKPAFEIFNHQWGSYMLKNQAAWSSVLPDNRLVLPHGLRGECRRLWAIIRGDERP